MDIIFSLIIPTFNSHEDLESLLLSLISIKNELDQVEILVVDDGSYDDTQKVVGSFIDRFQTLNYYYQKNRGPAAARNQGAKKALGKYIIFIDDDCLVPKGCLEAIKAFYKTNTDYAGVGVKTINSSNSVFSEFNQRLGDHLIASSQVSGDTYEYVSSRCYSFIKESFWAINGHDEGFIWPAAEDRDFCLRLKEAEMKFAYLQTIAVTNTDHLGLRGFIKQNFIYGLGAGLLNQKHPNRLSFKFSRYKDMLLRISKDKDLLLQFKLTLTFILAQICSIAGVLCYRINYDYKNRPPSVFPPRVFIFVETLKNLILGIPFIRSIKNHFGSLSTGEELFSSGSLVSAAQNVKDIYRNVILKEFGEDDWVQEKRILEIGPGSHLGVAISFLAQGAYQVVAVDKYGEVKFRKKEAQIYEQMLAPLPDKPKEKISNLLADLTLNKISGFNRQRPLNYLPDISIDSLRIVKELPVGYFDLIVSFNTMEHIKDLNGVFRNMNTLLKKGGIMIHRVDAGSHYAVYRHSKNLLSQFLYSDKVWEWMFSNRNAPTRKVLADYVKIAQEEDFFIKESCVDELVAASELNNSRRFLSSRFYQYFPEEISKTGFILIVRKC